MPDTGRLTTGFTVTIPGGTPVIVMSCATEVDVPMSPAPVLIIYMVVVELRDWTGWTDSWETKGLLRGPNVTWSTLERPATISALPRTQYWSPP